MIWQIVFSKGYGIYPLFDDSQNQKPKTQKPNPNTNIYHAKNNQEMFFFLSQKSGKRMQSTKM
jgi:hypothetical protein